MIPDPLCTPKEVAALLGIHPRTLRQWRYDHHGPRWCRLSERAIRYYRKSVERWRVKYGKA